MVPPVALIGTTNQIAKAGCGLELQVLRELLQGVAFGEAKTHLEPQFAHTEHTHLVNLEIDL